MPWHPVDRTALVDAFAAAGPGAPTLCEGWRTEHLAAHVHLREADPLTAAGIVVPALAGRTERVTQRYGDTAVSEGGWDDLVDDVRRGPAIWHPLRLLGDQAQLAELHVHAEDVRRAGPGGAGVAPRVLAAGHRDALWTALTRMTSMLYRSSPRRLVLVETSGLRHACGPKDAAGGVVELHGGVTELMLHGFGREAVAHLTLVGADDDVAAVRAWRAPLEDTTP